MSRVLIFHYHLNPGGVTRIIESQVKSLMLGSAYRDIIIVTGCCDTPRPFNAPGTSLEVNEDLNYLSAEEDPRKIYSRLQDFFSGLVQKDDILHCHNLNLGKNPVVTAVIAELAWKGYYVLNHAHDFAEDRPDNFAFMRETIERKLGKKLSPVLYPQLKNYLFATLNSFDQQRLVHLGIEEERITMLPNPIAGEAITVNNTIKDLKQKVCDQLHISANKLLVTYPVRVIRRKNIGEFILLALLFESESHFLVTQPPRNPLELVPYLGWKKFCIESSIPVVFEAGLKTDFEELMRATDFCVTTSRQEGFGMAFMEPWLYGKPVIGRNIPEVTRDLESSGVNFPMLYDELKVMSRDAPVDFSSLGDDEQKVYITDLQRNKNRKKQLTEMNPWLKTMFQQVRNELIEENQTILLNEYSLENYARRLESLYQKFAR